MPKDRLTIHASLVRRLIDVQFPQWRELSIRPVDVNGWDNATFRLGDHMKVRLPTAARYVVQVEKERRWLPYLAPLLPLQIPAFLALGAPAEHYKFPWSVCSWIDGDLPSATNDFDRNSMAIDLARFLTALQQIPANEGPLPGPHCFFRGGPLLVYDKETRSWLEKLKTEIDVFTATRVWETALDSPYEAGNVWVHGDFAPSNLLVANGSLRAVIDFGSCAVGDPACDLVIAWTFLDGQSREIFRSNIQADQRMWARARGWALWKALLQLGQQTGSGSANDRGGRRARRVIDDVLSEYEI